MPDYSVSFAASACKELESLEAGLVRLIFPKIEALAAQPRPPGCRKLEGFKNLWRIRVGDYRIVSRDSLGRRIWSYGLAFMRKRTA